MAEEKSVEIPRVKLGTQGFEVLSYISYYDYSMLTIFYNTESSFISQ